jgi:molybdate transport system ATP-binding protein
MTLVRIGKKVPQGLSLDVEFAIGPGVTALYGPSGSGKTLLLKGIAGLATPDSGRILVDDAIVFDAAARVNLPARSRRCGFIFQRGALFPHLTLRQNLAFAAQRFARLDRHRRIAESLEAFQLGAAAELRPAAAGPAERLRCAVARALIGEPRLLLADDAAIGEALLLSIRETFKNPILLATREMDLCCSAASQLLLLEAGRVVRTGPSREVLDQPQSLEAARLLGIANIFQGTIAALDPGRNSSRVELDGFALSAPYIPGHFRGDRVWIAIRAEALRVHAGDVAARINFVPAKLARVSERTRSVLLEFAGGISAEVSREQFAREKDNKEWQVEFPPESLRIL